MLKQKLENIKTRFNKFVNKATKQAQRIAIATIIMQFILAIGFSQLVKTDFYAKLTAEPVKTIENVQAKEPTKEPETKPEPTEAERIADIIYTLESSQGKNNYSKCEAQGLFNGYGYAIPGNGNYKCFEKGEDRKAVINWIQDKQAQGMTEAELLCYYNTGTITSDCDYYHKSQTIQQ